MSFSKRAIPVLAAVAVAAVLGVLPEARAQSTAAARRSPPAPPTPIPTPVPPERVSTSPRKGAAPTGRVQGYDNPHVRFSKLSRVEQVDLDNDGEFEVLLQGIGTVDSLPPDIPAVGFVSRARLPFENPLLAVLKRAGGSRWDLLLVAHVPLLCTQAEDPDSCDELDAFRSVRFRFDDRPQVALQITHAGEPHLVETHMYRLERGRFETTFSTTAARSGVEVDFGPAGIRRRIAVDTFLNRDLPSRYRSFTLTTTYVFGDRKFRILSESLEPEWSDRQTGELAYWGLVHQASFAGDLARLQERQRKAAETPWTLDPVELVRKRFPDASNVRLGIKLSGIAVVYFNRIACPAHVVVYQPLREWEGEKAFWDFAVIRSPEEGAYECLGEEPVGGRP
jgi:hypothetical protein